MAGDGALRIDFVGLRAKVGRLCRLACEADMAADIGTPEGFAADI
jgi:hypothetical protein